MLVNLVDIADGVLVNTIWSIGQMVARLRAGRQAAANMDIAGWADTEALVREALPDLQLELPGLTEVDAEELAVALKRDEVQGALQALLAARLTDAPEADATKAREAVRLGLRRERPNELGRDAGVFYAQQLSDYFDDKICALVAELEGRVGLAGLAQVRAEAYSGRIVALLGAIERQVAALSARGAAGGRDGVVRPVPAAGAAKARADRSAGLRPAAAHPNLQDLRPHRVRGDTYGSTEILLE